MLTQTAYNDVEQDERQWQDEQREEEAWINYHADLELEKNCLSLWVGW